MKASRVRFRGFLHRLLPWRRPNLGAFIALDRIVVVERDGDALRWVLDGPGLGQSELTSDVIAAMLDRLPASRVTVRGRRIAVVLSADLVQCKVLFGLPPIRDSRTADAIVRESATRFFRRTAEEMLTSPISTDAEGRPAAAAFPADLVRALRNASAARRIELVAVMPVESLGDAAGGDGGTDDPVIRYAWRAAGAASAGRSAPFNALHSGSGATAMSRTSLRAAAIGAIAGVLFMLASPLVVVRVIANRAERERAPQRVAESSAFTLADELATVSEALAELNLRTADRKSTIGLIAELAVALPPGAAITYLHLDSAGVTLTSLAPSADLLLKGVAAMTASSRPQIVGPVTRERHVGRELERVHLRFSHRAPTSARSGR